VTPEGFEVTPPLVRAELEAKIAALPGVEERVSRYGHGRSFAAGGREIAHFHGETRMDVRLTREEIRRRRADGTLDPRLVTRGAYSEWVEVTVTDTRDLAFALSLVEEAIRANQ
jgi:hypothetical protein